MSSIKISGLLALVLLGISSAAGAAFQLDTGDDALLGLWIVASVETGSDKAHWLCNAAEVRFGIPGKFGALDVPRSITLETQDGRTQVFPYRVAPASKPGGIDLVESPPSTKVYRGIYEVTGDGLKLCFNLTDEGRPKEFSAKAGTRRVLLILRRPPEKKALLPDDRNLGAIDFERHVHALLDRQSCNAGKCHGTALARESFH